MKSNLILLPAPRQIEQIDGVFSLPARRLILLLGGALPELRFSACRFQDALNRRHGIHWQVTASLATPPALIGMTLRVDPASTLPAEGYELRISPDGIRIDARDQAGAFYAVCTVVQIIEQSEADLPCLHITDWPDFPVRGVMLDISRDKVPTMETLFALVDLLAGWKINHLQLYTEHTFAYQRHPVVWEKASPMTGEDILDLDSYCRQRGIELVPNQNSFGHMHHWLKHAEYTPLGEVTKGFKAPWAWIEGPFSLTPGDPRSLELIFGLYDELLPHFSSRLFNVGCDETFDLGQGRSKEEVEKRGAGQVYLEYLLKIYQNVKSRGLTMLFWGDIIIQHPELIPQLPKDVVALEWGYEADHPFDRHAAQFAASGVPFYVCPGTSTWTSIAGRSENALKNLLCAAETGLKNGAIGYLITDWGDNGHWQTLPVSYLGFAAGAAYSWALEPNRMLDIPEAINRFAFRDQAGLMGCLAYKLGNVYSLANIVWENASVFSSILQRPISKVGSHPKIQSIDFDGVLAAVDQIMLDLPRTHMDRPDAALVEREFELAARMLRHACRRGKLAVAVEREGLASIAPETLMSLAEDWLEIQVEYQQVWLSRNRPGGLSDSLAHFETARRDYLSGIKNAEAS